MKGAKTSASRASEGTTLKIRDLEQSECERLLSRNHIGRIAFTFKDRVDIEPISYVFFEGAIYARTTPGTKLNVIAHHPWVAFEVDEIRGPYDWESVVVKGTVYLVEQDLIEHPGESYEHAKRVMRAAMPSAFTPADPFPQRSVLLRIQVNELTGRAAHLT